MDGGEGGEEGAQVDDHVGHLHVAEVVPEVLVAEVGEDDDDLVRRAEGRDQGADGGAAAQVVEELNLVQDAHRGGRDVDLLDGDELGSSAGHLARVIAVLALQRRRRPLGGLVLLLVVVPFVLVLVVLEIFGFVNSREGA